VIFTFFSFFIVILSSLCDVGLFVVFVRRRLSFLFFPGILIDSDCQISFDPVQIQSMTLASSTLQIRHGYSGDLNIVICVGICTLPFYAINMDDVSLFTNSSFLFLVNLHYIDVLYQFE